MRAMEFRLRQTAQPLNGAWQVLPIAPRHSTLLGISFRPLQAAAFGLDIHATLRILLTYPFHLIRLAAYWNRIETEPGTFQPDELDWQIDAAEQAGKQIILCLGPLKNFGYPEFFVPEHRMPHPIPEHTLVGPEPYPFLLKAAIETITRLVERYKHHQSIIAWQLEHEAVDPLGVEHSWRIGTAFVEQEVQALRKVDPTRPLLMNGYLPTSLLVRISQWWQTRDQGDSLAVAQRLADMIGIDYYPRNALVTLGSKTLYLDGSQSRWQQQKLRQLLEGAIAHGKKVLISEGQAEPWETATIPPNPHNLGLYSCLPEHIISNYNSCITGNGVQDSLYAYLFWGAEYWMLRNQTSDSSYLRAFIRICENSG